MSKTKITSRPSTNAVEPKTDASTGEAKAKPQRGHVATAGAPRTTPGAKAVQAEPPTSATNASSDPKPPRRTKAALLRARLAEPGGVSLTTLIEATGWQAHTLRAAMSGLRKEGLTLTRRREGEHTIYATDPVGTAAATIAGEGAVEEIAPEAPRAAMPEDRDLGAVDAAAVSHPTESNA